METDESELSPNSRTGQEEMIDESMKKKDRWAGHWEKKKSGHEQRARSDRRQKTPGSSDNTNTNMNNPMIPTLQTWSPPFLL